MANKKSIDTSFIHDLPCNSGSLNDYRNKAKFDWKLLRIYLEGEESLRAKYDVWYALEKDPLFARSTVTPSADDQKKLAALRMKRTLELQLLPEHIKNATHKRRVNFIIQSSNFDLFIKIVHRCN
jgi:hypothetical protein